MTTLSNENFSFDQAESGQFENTPKSFREVLKDYLLPGQQTRGDRLALQPNYDYTSKKEQYQISISHDGKFVATLDTENLRIKVLRNTDYRGSHRKKEKDLSQQNASENIDERIALFKINNNLTVNKIYGKNETPPRFDNENNDYISNTDELSGTINNNNRFRWSLDISNMDEKFLFVAVSYIDIDEDMKCLEKRSKCQMFNYKKIKMQEATYNEKSNSYTINIPHDTQEFRKGIAIYRLRLKISKNGMEEKFILEKGYYWNNLSGICRFIENFDPTSISNKIDTPHYILTRFITLNFDGIFNFVYNKSNKNFHLNERFNYPKIIKNELKNWHTKQNLPDCMDRLVSCIYDKYFLVEHYKNNAQFLEVYDLANMKLESSAKRINGLEISSRNFEELEKIYFLEFIENDEKLLLIGSDENNNQNMIVWDLYNTDKIEIFRLENDLIIQNFDTHLARTSGNLLRVDNKGDITSMLKMIENKLKEETREEINKANLVEYIAEIEKEPIHKEYLYQERHTIFFFDSYEENNFRPLINETEPWVMDNYDEYSFYLCNDEIEALQLIVGRSTIQIWHKIISDPKEKEKENLPNQGNPFLEFIWTNGIPVKQEYFGIEEKMKNMEEIKGKSLKTRKVKWDDINENIMGIRYACKSLEHLNKRARSLVNYDRKHKYENMVMYINHIVWRYINHKPDQYRLLDVRHNVMKNLILGDCDHLIKFILFGSKEYETNILWQRKEDKYIQADDLEPFDNEEDSKDIEEILPRNDMELAIYHCKGRELRDTIMVAYLLEYYSRHAKDYAGWMSTVSKSLPLLYKYDYDDYTRKLFRKECFADQNHFSAQDSHEIIPKKYNIKRNNNPEFKAFKPIDKLKSDRESYNSNWKAIKSVKNKVSIWLENFDNANGKPPLALRVVPLPGFTTHTIKSERVDYSLRKNIMNIIWFLLLPRWYKISRNEKDKLSPFSRVIRYENNDDMFDNPATEAVINFYPNIEARDSTISGIATSQNTNDVFNVQLVNDFDRTDYEDNPYSYFPTALEASYFWLNGNFVQRDDFDSWAVEAFTLIASIMLVTILQNILIAIMGGVYGEAATKGRQALLRFRANQIADYEALHHLHFQHQEPEPKYIYYIGQAKNFEEWYKSRKGDRGQIYKEFEEKSTFTRYNFKESSIDEVSIWKFDDKHKNDKKKEKKAEKILKSAKSTDIEEELSKGKHSAQGTIGKNDEVIDKEIQEIEQLRHDMNSLVDKLIGKLNSQKFK
ncbi:12733_t:CDS:10 [Funneliformis geosporum]|nr:12733_t:CDS:10 [Funneliformis geosporum]